MIKNILSIIGKSFIIIALTGILFTMLSCNGETEELTVQPTTRAAVTIVTDHVTKNTTWSGEIELANKIAVMNSAVLTIAPGTIIRGQDKGNFNHSTALIITKGSKINTEVLLPILLL